mmetsp:Transcript_26813/g.87983  ORF Transcript_26813/g.87983 Transcript_26813/m.87983 type:complete len:270 (+) Transcript_26813:1437-2246(+)
MHARRSRPAVRVLSHPDHPNRQQRASTIARGHAEKARERTFSFGSSVVYDEEGQGTYTDSLLDLACIGLFNVKLAQALGRQGRGGVEGSGYARLVGLADRIRVGRTPQEQRVLVTSTLLNLIPAPIRFLFKKLIDAEAAWVGEMNTWVTVNAFSWLVGPAERKPRAADGVAEVHIPKCRYLEASTCAGTCVNLCKLPTEAFFKDAFGVDLYMKPDFAEGSCSMRFGEAPPADDPALSAPCLAACSGATATGAGRCPRIQGDNVPTGEQH